MLMHGEIFVVFVFLAPRHRVGGLWAESDGCYFDVTAAAMGVRIVLRAVAASSSISVFRRLMTHSIASRP